MPVSASHSRVLIFVGEPASDDLENPMRESHKIVRNQVGVPFSVEVERQPKFRRWYIPRRYVWLLPNPCRCSQ